MSSSEQINFSLAGCGFLGIYHVGVTSALQAFAPAFLQRKWSGASAGAMSAVYFLCGVPPENAVTDILDLCRIARSSPLGLFTPTIDVTAIVRDAMERHLPVDAHVRVSGLVHISLTRCSDLTNVIVSEFETREDLIQVILCSGFIPIFSGWTPPTYKGSKYMDGGWSNNHLVLDDHTRTVSPFSGESDICPRDHINLLSILVSNTSFQLSRVNFSRVYRAIFPPKPHELINTFKHGFQDTVKFLQGNGLITCCACACAENNNASLEHSNCKDCEFQNKSTEIKDNFPQKVLDCLNAHEHLQNEGISGRIYGLAANVINSTTATVKFCHSFWNYTFFN